jgi:hypothetical protein
MPGSDLRLRRKSHLVMRFFLPAVFDTCDAEETLPNIKILVEESTGCTVKDGRIFSVEYKHGGNARCITVGDQLPSGTVECIFDSDYVVLVCPFQEGLFGRPILIEKRDVVCIEFFEGYEVAWAA